MGRYGTRYSRLKLNNMIIFLIAYICGFIISLLLLIYNEPEYITIGDLTKFLFMSIFSWIIAIAMMIVIYDENKDKIIIKKKKYGNK